MSFEQSANSPYGPLAASHKLVPLAELCEPQNGIQTGPFGSQLHKADYVESEGTPIITVEHLGENVVEGEGAPLVGDADLGRLQKYTLKAGDIVFSRVGSVDRRALVAREQEGWLFSGRLLRVRPEPQKVDPAYLSYFFGLPAFKAYIRSVAVGATMPSLNTNLLGAVPVILPPINTQRVVGQFLADIDLKIRLNLETVATLEGLISRTFRSWFIDFDPVKAKMAGEVPVGIDAETAALFPDSMEEGGSVDLPSGWSSVTIADLCASISNGSTPKRSVEEFWENPVIDWYKTGELRDNFLLRAAEGISETGIESSSVRVMPGGTVLMAIYAAPTVGRLGILTEDSVFNQACTGLVPRPEIGTAFLYMTLKHLRPFFIGRSNGAAQQNISKLIVESAPCIRAPREIQEKFNELVSPIFELWESLTKENARLSEIRDSLLPRLVSGELEIPDEMLAA